MPVSAKAELYSKSIATDWTRKASPGSSPEVQAHTLVGLDAQDQGVRAELAASSPSKARKGTPWKVSATSVTRAGRRLPVRM